MEVGSKGGQQKWRWTAKMELGSKRRAAKMGLGSKDGQRIRRRAAVAESQNGGGQLMRAEKWRRGAKVDSKSGAWQQG